MFEAHNDSLYQEALKARDKDRHIIKGEGITASQTLSLHFYVTSRNLARIGCDQPCEENDPRWKIWRQVMDIPVKFVLLYEI